MATVREAPAVSKISLPATGNIVDVFTADGQGYICEDQKELTPWLISLSRDTDGTIGSLANSSSKFSEM